MSDNLALKIRDLIDEKKLSVMALEKKSGLKNGAVRNILSGHSKKPSAEILLAISRVLGCTIGELLDEETDPKDKKNVLNEITFSNKHLLHQTIDHILDFMSRNNIPIKNKDLYESIEKIYQYIERKSGSEFDKEFADWYLEERF
ncbi:MAG: hypothetical protein C0514_09115 [Candidatus Puniceispirillum sp.]|nr:hypothetical protein [Candidatus Puniceispirillum sp.]